MQRLKQLSLVIMGGMMMLMLSACVASASSKSMSTESPAVIRLTVGEWEPFISERAPHYGVYSVLVTEAFAEEGITVEYGFFSWDEAMEQMKRGVWDGSMPWVKTPDRESYAMFSSVPVARQVETFFYRQDYEFDWETIEDLQGHRIGLMPGYVTTEKLEIARDGGMALLLDVQGNELTNLKRLVAGEIDVFPCDVDVCTKLLQAYFTPEEMAAVTRHPKIWSSHDLYLLIDKQNPYAEEWIQSFDQGMRKLYTSGRYDEIIQKFLNGAYDTPAP